MKLSKMTSAFLFTLSLGLAVQAQTQLGGNDTHPAVKISTFAASLSPQQRQAFIDVAKAQVGQVVHNPILLAGLNAQLDKLTTTQDFSMLDRFPILPLQQVKNLRTALGAHSASSGTASTQSPAKIYSGENYADLMSKCDAQNKDPDPVPNAPGMTNGFFVDPSLSKCEIDQSYKLADMLTSLAANNSSKITYTPSKQGAATVTVTTPRELIQALLDDGHQIRLLDERVYADFISINAKNPQGGPDVEIIWPTWIDTGLKLTNGTPLIVPMSHSQYLFQLDGKVTVDFFLGIDGTGFFPNVDVRPNWTGGKIVKITDSTVPNDAQLILTTMDAASSYYRQMISEEQNFVAPKKLPDFGYGILGVCNDSIAALEKATGIQGIPVPYPLLRDPQLDAAAPTTNLQAIMRGLPHDGDTRSPKLKDVLPRVLSMVPFQDVSQLKTYISNDLYQLILEAQKEAAQ